MELAYKNIYFKYFSVFVCLKKLNFNTCIWQLKQYEEENVQQRW